MFDTLVSSDEMGRPEPALAMSWQAEPGNQRWQFFLRRGVTFSEGSAMTPDAVAASLRRANPTWKVFSDGEAVVIERDSPAPNLPAELALLRNSIAKRDSGKVAGTGPFAVSQWNPGKTILLTAREDYWGGRAFLEAIETELGKSFRDRALSFELGKAQVIEVAPEQAHRATVEGGRVESSAPVELIALVFSHDSQSPEGAKQRQAFALSIDRDLLNTVVLQGGGEPAGGLLPNWMSGYGFVFPASINLALARQVRSEIPHTTVWTLSYDPADPAARVIAERIVLNARDAGLGLQITSGSAADLRLLRVPLVSLNAELALSELAATLGLPPPRVASSSIEDQYAAENKLLQSQRVIPLLHLRTAWATSARVKNWRTVRDGSWSLPSAWLAAEKP
jgi:ABC-type transport system substrate-binding protein